MSCGCNTSTSIFPVNAGCPPLPPGNQYLPTPCLVAGSGLNMCADWIGNMQVTLDGGQAVVRNGNCLQVMYSQVSGPMRFDALTQKMIITSDALQAPLNCDVWGLPVMGVLAECGTAQRFLRFQTPVQDFTGVPVAYQQKCGTGEYRQINLVPKSMPGCPPTGLRRTKSRMIMCQGTATWEHYKEDEIHQDEALVVNVDLSESTDNEVDGETMELAIWQEITCTDTSGQQNTGFRLRKLPEEDLITYLERILSGRNRLINITEVLVGSNFVDGLGAGAGIDLTSFIRNLVATTSPSGTFSTSAMAGTPIPAGTKTVQCLARCVTDSSGGGRADAYAKIGSSVKIEDHQLTGGENSSTDHVWFDVELDTNGNFTYDIGATISGDAAAYADIWITGYWN